MKDSAYFDSIEQLGSLMREAVVLVCGGWESTADNTKKASSITTNSTKSASLSSIQHKTSSAANSFRRTPSPALLSEISAEADLIAGRIMTSTSADFITPLGRGDIARIALSLRRAVRAACAAGRFTSGNNGDYSHNTAHRTGNYSPAATHKNGDYSLAASHKYSEQTIASCLILSETAQKFSGQLRRIKKKGPLPSAAAYFEAMRINNSLPQKYGSGTADLKFQRLYGSLCDCCEEIIVAAMNNI